MTPYWESKEAKLYKGDCRDVMPEFNENSVDSMVTDPPYHLTTGRISQGGAPSEVDCAKTPHGRSRVTGFMGKKWDGGDVAFQPATWEKAYRILKPGGYLLAMGGTRTYHRLVCAIEDAGFEIRDSVAWITGQGFPKNHNISKAIDGEAGAEREVVGKKIRGDVEKAKTSGVTMAAADANKNNKDIFGYGVEDMTVPCTNEAKQWYGWGTALKPAMELIVVARKPLSEGTVASNVLKWGTGAINIDGCRIEGESVPINRLEQWSGFGQEKRPDYEQEINDLGRWPSNLIHDGSDEVLEKFAKYGERPSCMFSSNADSMGTIFGGSRTQGNLPMDKGTAARFFYCAKASQEDRNEGCEHIPPTQYSHDGRETPIDNAYQRNASNAHPTVKPTALMRYLVKLVTPPDGTVLDPFNGSGSTGKAALYEGFKYIGIEGEQEYCEISKARIQFVMENDSPLFR